MTSPLEVEFLQERVSGAPMLDVALAAVLLDAVARAERGPMLRCYQPVPTVAFGRRDTFLPGFASAARVTEQHGFAPVIRAQGGRAAAYDDGCLVIDAIMPDAAPLTGIRDRFAREAERQAQALRGLGVDARVGEVPGEYCPGAFTVNARARTKLLGSAQRVIRGGWLLSTVVVVDSATRLRSVLEDVYAALDLDWNPDTVGDIAEEAPGVRVDDVKQALLNAYAHQYRLLPATIPRSALAAARERIARHLPR
jgi:lipoate-protein ligase A